MSKNSEKTEKVSRDVEIEIGYRLEAKDLAGNWYPAKVVKVNESKKRLLIHFDRWNSKFDEWLSMSSDRIRSLQKPEPKAEKRFAVGDRVLAVWSVYQKYPATVQKVLTNGKYKVVFDDGYSKVLVAGKMWPNDENPGESGTMYTPPIGSKQDRRDRKRKIVVSDLFRSNKRPRMSESSPVSPAAPRTPSVEVSAKGSTAKEKEMPAQPVPDSTLPIRVEYPNGTKEVWQKYFVARTEGKTAGKYDVVIVNQEGRKFRTKLDIVSYLDANKIKYEPEDVEYSTKQHRTALNNAKLGEGKESKDTKMPVLPVAPPVAPEKEKITPAKTAAKVSATTVPTPVTPATPEISEDVVLVAGMEVNVVDGQLICPDTTCRKHFRKDSLLQMHMKHYHPKMAKLLDYTPSVTELAYARHVSGLTPTTPENRPPRLSYTKEVSVEIKPVAPETPAPPPPDAVNPVASPSVAQVCTPMATLSSQPASPVASPARPPPDYPSTTKTLMVKARKLENLPTASFSLSPESQEADFEKDIRCNIILRPKTESADVEVKTASCSEIVGSNPILNTLLKSAPASSPANVPDASSWPVASTSQDLVVGEDDKQDTLVDVEGNEKKYEKLKMYELINCTCLLKEEDGMMIQCEVCMCWQHGHCLGFMTEDEVPDAYMCLTCKNPPRGRSSAKYLNHQLWLKKGKLPTLENKEDENSMKRQELLRRAFDTSGQLVMLSRVLHSLTVKLSIADNKHHHKLYLWINKWHSALSPNSSPKHEDKIKTEPGIPHKIQPEKAFDPLECKMNLLEHIEKMQDQVQERLNRLEEQVDELEKMEDEDKDSSPIQLQEASESNSCLVKTSATIQMLLRDLSTVQRLALL